MPPNRLPIVDSDDGVWGDILRQYLMQEHVNDDTDNPLNGGHKTITIQPGTAAAGTAPLKFSSGSLLTTPEAGAIEFLSDRLYFTQTTGTTRKTIAAYNDASGAQGDIYYRDSGGNFTKLAIGSNGDILTVNSGIPAWTSTIAQSDVTDLETDLASKLDSSDFTSKASGGANLVISPDFEDTSVSRTNYGSPVSPGYSTEQARSGTNSWKWTTPTLGSTSGIQFDVSDPNISTNVTVRVQPGDKFYVSAWIYAHASNNHASGGGVQLTARFVDSTGSLGHSYQNDTIALSSLPVSTWTKLHISLDVPAGYDRAVTFVTTSSSTPQGNIYYVDDLVWQSVSVYRQGAEIELFNTKDEETNYEKVRHRWDGGVYKIGTEQGGTGQVRDIMISSGGSTPSLALSNQNANKFDFVAGSGIPGASQTRLSGSLTGASGTQMSMNIVPTINQSGTAGYTALLVNPSHSSTGSGTKLLADFQLGGSSKVAIDTTGIITAAAAGTSAGSVVTVDGAQTLTNKTLTAPKLANGGYIADANSQVLLGAYTTASAVNFLTIANAATGGWPVFGATGTDTNVGMWFSPKGTGSLGIYAPSGQTAKLRAGGIDANHNLDLIPKGSGTVQANGIEVATISGTQTLTNKTINASNNTLSNIAVSHFAASAIVTESEGIASNDNDTTIPTSAAVKDYVDVTLSPTFQDNTFTLQDNSDTTKQARFELSSITTSTTRTFTLPDANTTLVGTGTVQTLTNKTLTSPRINNILDTNGATILNFSATASADNYLTIANGNATWVGLQANGASASIPIYMYPKGGGPFTIYTSAGYTPTIQANGQDTNLNLNLTSKGTGTVQANGVDVVTTTGTQTLTNKTLSAPTITGNPNFTGQPVMGDYAFTTPTLHLKGGSGGNAILQLSRGSGVTPSDTFDFALAGGGLSIRDVGAGGYLALNTFAASGSAELYVGQKYTVSNQSNRTGTLSATTHGSGAGSNIGGPNLIVQGGGGTGTGTPGDIQFKTFSTTTSGSTQQSSTVRATIAATTGVMTITNPGTIAGSVVSVDGTQTLTNKTLTAPRVDYIKDANGANALAIAATASAVNYITVRNRPAGQYPAVEATGSDTNINIQLVPKGSGYVEMYSSTGNTPKLRATGADANLDLNLISKGTGVVQANGVEVATISNAQVLTNKTINLSSNTLTGTTAQFNAALSDGDFATTASLDNKADVYAGDSIDMLQNTAINLNVVNGYSTISPIINGIAYNNLRGGSTTVEKNGSPITIANIDNAFTPTLAVAYTETFGSSDEWVITVNLWQTTQWRAIYGITLDASYRVNDVEIEVYYDSAWHQIYSVTNTPEEVYSVFFGGNGASPVSAVRYTIGNPINSPNSTGLRISSIFVLPSGGDPLSGFVSREGGAVYGAISYASDPSGGNELTRKTYVDSGTATLSNKTISGSSNTLSNIALTSLTSSTSTALGVGTLELGHASDTTLSRASAGRLAVEGINVPTISSTDTLTNKTLSAPVLSGTITGTYTFGGTPTFPSSVVTTTGTQTLTNKTINASSNTISNIAVSHMAASAIVTEGEGIASNDNDTTIPTSAAVKDYVDNAGTSTFQDSAFTIQDNGDNTKQVKFEVSGVATGTTRTISVPNADFAMVGTNTAQTLTNKTINLTSNTLSGTIAQFNTALSDGDFATTADLLTKADGTTVAGQGNAVTTEYRLIGSLPIDSSANYSSFMINGRIGGWTNANMAQWSIMVTNRSDYSGDNIMSAVICTGNVASATTLADIVIYKQVDKSALVYLKLDSYYAYDFTVKAYQATVSYTGGSVTPTGSQIWALSTANKLSADTNGNILGSVAPTANAHLTRKDYVDSGTATLSNKTLSSPRVNQINDTNGNTSLVFDATASAVNYLAIANKAAGAHPSIVARGASTDIGITFTPKGAGNLTIYSDTGQTPRIVASGNDTNHNLELRAKGAGVVKANNDGTDREIATISGTQTLTNKTLNASTITGTHTMTGAIDYTPTSGHVLTFGGTGVITRYAGGNNKSIGIGGDDTVIIGGGESKGTIASNVNLATETVEIGGENGVNIHISTDNWASWANRKTTSFTGTGITWDGNQVWHAGNDGAGSGLDADTLDGQQASAFASASHTHVATDISNSTSVGRSVLTAVDAAAARTAIGAGTGNGDVTLSGTQTLSNKSFSGPFYGNRSGVDVIRFNSDNNGAIDLGRQDNVASSPFIDFNSGATTTDFDARIQATGGTGSNGAGTLNITAGTFSHNTIPVVTTTGSQALTNKDMTSGTNTWPTFNQNTTGSAATLTTARTFRTNLSSTSTASFNGSANVTPGVQGTLGVVNGGTGATTLTGIVVGNGTSPFTTISAPSGAIVGTTDAQTLTNKTINGSNNTFLNIPSSAITGLDTDFSKLVVDTQAGSTGTENGANTWAHIATFSTGTSQYSECQLILSVSTRQSARFDSAMVAVYFRSNSTSSNPAVGVEIIAHGGSGDMITSDSFKVISDGWSSDMQLWFKKGNTYGAFSFYETSKSLNGGTLTYTSNPGWQSAIPSGSVNNVSSDGITAFGQAVWHAGNDGSGSGLDADLLDGMNTATGATGNTIAARTADGDISARYTLTSYVNMSHSVSTRSSDTVFFSSTDNYIRKNNATGFKTSLGLNNVDNTADASKSVLSAAQLTTARTIGGVSFNGTANINLPGVNIAGNQDTSGNAATATTSTYVTSGMPNNTDNYMNFRVIRNTNASTSNDGMYIGYGNTNNGDTRLFGGGNTSNPVTIGNGGTVTATGTVQGTRLISTQSTGTAPLTVSSTTVVTNLNADLLDGQHASAFASSSHTHVATNISDSTATGRSVLTAANAAAARSAIGAGTGNGDVTLAGAQSLTNKTLDSTNNINAGAITSGWFNRDRIGIPDFTNFASGSDFETGENPWYIGSGWSVASDQAYTGTYSFKSVGATSGSSTLKGEFEVKQNDLIYIEFWMRRDASWNGGVGNSKLRIGDQNNSLMGAVSFAAADAPADTWTKRSGLVGVDAGETSLTITLVANDATAGNVWIDDIVIKKINNLDDTFYLNDGTDSTKRAKFSVSGISSGTTRYLALPNANTTLVGDDATQTLSNKTLTDPRIGNIMDTNGLLSAAIIPRASAVNYFEWRGGAAGQAVYIKANGSDTNVDLDLLTKGSGKVLISGVEAATISGAQTLTNKNMTSGTNTWPTFNQNTTGNAATATALQTARTIGGVSFNGTANINLPGVNIAGNQNTSGNAATATTATNVSGGTVSASTGTFTSYVETDELRQRTGQQLVINVGESHGQATGQTGELLYINAENGLEINSSPDNWSSGWAGRNTASINNPSGNSSFPGTVQATRFISTQSTGTSPLTVSSTTVVTNLNADMLDGQHASAFVTTSGSQTLTNKTFNDDSFTLQDGSDNSKKIVFSLDGMSASETITLQAPNIGTGNHTIVVRNSTDTLKNKRIEPRAGTTASTSSLTINTDSYDAYSVTALAANITVNNPSGTPTAFDKFVLRIRDNGTPRSISWGSNWQAVGVSLPVVTTANKTLYIGAMYNDIDSKWDVVAVEQQA